MLNIKAIKLYQVFPVTVFMLNGKKMCFWCTWMLIGQFMLFCYCFVMLCFSDVVEYLPLICSILQNRCLRQDSENAFTAFIWCSIKFGCTNIESLRHIKGISVNPKTVMRISRNNSKAYLLQFVALFDGFNTFFKNHLFVVGFLFAYIRRVLGGLLGRPPFVPRKTTDWSRKR